MKRRLVLASKSPRRREILANAGLDFDLRTADVEEVPQADESPVDYVRRLCASKAAAVPASDDEVVLGADTIVVVDGTILEKPMDAADAARMLRELSGRTHEVITGICLRTASGSVVDHSVTRVRVAEMSDTEIAWYVATGEPMDKAGAYGIQGKMARWIESVEGCYLNVVGLPLSLFYKHWRAL
jgi:septum formation protein